jgi:iron complex transport system permease protein
MDRNFNAKAESRQETHSSGYFASIKMSGTLRVYLIVIFLLLATATLSVAFGAVVIPFQTLVRMVLSRLPGIALTPDWPQSFETIFFQIRLPHTLLVLFSGAALSASGAAYQGLFRNPLADPYLIGAASGAGLGAVLVLTLREQGLLVGLYLVPAAAFVGALGTVALVYSLASTRSGSSTTMLILAGVAVSSFASAITSGLMLRSQGELRRSLSWLLGGGGLAGWEPVLVAFPYILVGVGILLTSGHALNVLQFGEEQAKQMGLPVQRARRVIILAASLATAAAISFSGIIGFVGLIVPHVIRLWRGPDYRGLIPLSLLSGASALLLADLLARLVLRPQELPVGIITALAGAPFFLWVLRRYQSGVTGGGSHG